MNIDNCNKRLQADGKPYPRTCATCGLFGKCPNEVPAPPTRLFENHFFRLDEQMGRLVWTTKKSGTEFVATTEEIKAHTIQLAKTATGMAAELGYDQGGNS